MRPFVFLAHADRLHRMHQAADDGNDRGRAKARVDNAPHNQRPK